MRTVWPSRWNERNIPHEKCLVDLQNKPENFTSTYARASPARAKVPVLEVGDDVLVESMVILEYLDRESAAIPIVRASGGCSPPSCPRPSATFRC